MTQNQSDGIHIISTDRNLTGASQGKLRSRVEQELEAGGRRILLDLSETRTVDSSGLGEVVRLHNMVRDRDGRLCLCDLQESAELLVRLTKLDDVLEVYGSRAEAVSAMGGDTGEA